MTDRGPLPSFLIDMDGVLVHIDMDGVLVHEEQAIPGAGRFLEALQTAGLLFPVLANNSIYTQRDLAARLARSGIELPPEAVWTSALATAQFLDTQRPGGTASVIGEAGLTTALHQVGYTLTERDPDYVVLGETRSYSLEAITRAIRLIQGGPGSSPPTPTPLGPRRPDRSRPPGRWPPSSPRPPGSGPTSWASRTSWATRARLGSETPTRGRPGTDSWRSSAATTRPTCFGSTRTSHQRPEAPAHESPPDPGNENRRRRYRERTPVDDLPGHIEHDRVATARRR